MTRSAELDPARAPVAPGPDPAALPAWKEARRTAILDAAKRALRRQRYEQIQIKDVADRARVALATLYRYFPSKEDLYVAVLVEKTRPVTPPPEHPESGADLLRSRMHLVMAAYEKDPSPFALNVSLYRSEDPNIHRQLGELSRNATRWLTEGIETTDGSAVEDIARMLWPIVHLGLREAILGSGTFEEGRRLADEFISIVAGRLRLTQD